MSKLQLKHRAHLLHYFTLFLVLTISSIARTQHQPIHWQVSAENPAKGLTLGYLLPKEKLQTIVGDSVKLKLDTNNMGFLMLFIAHAKQYTIDSTSYDNLEIAHILIALENSLTNPFIITENNEHLNQLFARYNFEVESGEIELLMVENGDSLSTIASIITPQGSINFSATCVNIPGDVKTMQGAKITAPSDAHCSFSGDESYRPISIFAAKIENQGINWMSQLKLPENPDRIWLNTEFIWDFKFTQE
ncbi:MAG: hypothetical protein V4638_11530 [Bacteroidota bacterium]